MAEQADSIYEEALVKAEKTARRVIERALGERATTYNLTLFVTYDEKGIVNVGIDLHVIRPRIDKKILDEVVNTAVEAAKQTFEKEINKVLDKKIIKDIKRS